MNGVTVIARCNDCGHTWPENGSLYCPTCGSDDISIVIIVKDDDEPAYKRNGAPKGGIPRRA